MYQKTDRSGGKKSEGKKTYKKTFRKDEGKPARSFSRSKDEAGASERTDSRPDRPRRFAGGEEPRGERPERRFGPGTEFKPEVRVRTVTLDSDVARVFRNSHAVNEALRHLIQIIDTAKASAPRPRFQASASDAPPFKRFGSAPRREGPESGTGPRSGAFRGGKKFEKRER